MPLPLRLQQAGPRSRIMSPVRPVADCNSTSGRGSDRSQREPWGEPDLMYRSLFLSRLEQSDTLFNRESSALDRRPCRSLTLPPPQIATTEPSPTGHLLPTVNTYGYYHRFPRSAVYEHERYVVVIQTRSIYSSAPPTVTLSNFQATRLTHVHGRELGTDRIS